VKQLSFPQRRKDAKTERTGVIEWQSIVLASALFLPFPNAFFAPLRLCGKSFLTYLNGFCKSHVRIGCSSSCWCLFENM
jgi:hypothetical protein